MRISQFRHATFESLARELASVNLHRRPGLGSRPSHFGRLNMGELIVMPVRNTEPVNAEEKDNQAA
jgi:hypothetical protein